MDVNGFLIEYLMLGGGHSFDSAQRLNPEDIIRIMKSPYRHNRYTIKLIIDNYEEKVIKINETFIRFTGTYDSWDDSVIWRDPNEVTPKRKTITIWEEK